MSTARVQTVQASAVVRCYAIAVMNPIDGGRMMIFQEQRLVQIGEQSITQEAGSCGLRFESGGSFPLLDHATDEPLGPQVTHDELYAMLYSAWRHAARLRDEGQGAALSGMAEHVAAQTAGAAT